MPFFDEEGNKHIIATDDVDEWSVSHIKDCTVCQGRFPIAYAKILKGEA